MRVGVAVDHIGYASKDPLVRKLRAAGHEVVDFGAAAYEADDDYPEYAIALARAIGEGVVKRGIVVCDSAIGACIAANKIRRVRAGNCHDPCSVQQGVQNDNINVLCLGSPSPSVELTWDLVQSFLAARFDSTECHLQRLIRIDQLEEPEVHG